MGENLKYEIRKNQATPKGVANQVWYVWDKEAGVPAAVELSLVNAQTKAVMLDLADLIDWVIGQESSQDSMQDAMAEMAEDHLSWNMGDDLEHYDKGMDAVASYLPRALRHLADRYEAEFTEMKLKDEIHRLWRVP